MREWDRAGATRHGDKKRCKFKESSDELDARFLDLQSYSRLYSQQLLG
jgi:hypothetical protein